MYFLETCLAREKGRDSGPEDPSFLQCLADKAEDYS
jgi:hypothetical protein